MKPAMTTKIAIKPIFAEVIHSAIWEGPCRVGTTETLDPVYESRAARAQFPIWVENLRKNIDPKYSTILEPAYLEYDENFVVTDEQLAEIAPNPEQIDLFLITYRVPGIERLRRPVAMINCGPTPIDLVSFYRDIGLEGYMAHDFDEFNDLMRLLKIKKAIANTKVLVLTAGEQFPVSVNSSNPDLYGLSTKYGIRAVRRSIRDVFVNFGEDETRAERAKQIYDNAKVSQINTDVIESDLRYYDAVCKMMEKLDCNAFTTACKELCATQLPMKNKCTPCMTHSLLRDRGIPSACEEDLNVWMAIMVLMYLTESAPFMGNPMLLKAHSRPIEDMGMSRVVFGPEEGFDEEMLEIRHAVPPTKMLGYDKPAMPYDLGHFTKAGWGTKLQVNMGNVDDRTVTIGRFDRHSDKILVVKGEICGCAYRDIECSPAIYCRVDGGAREFRHALADGGYGHHLAVVYGDWRNELKKLGKLVGFKVEVQE